MRTCEAQGRSGEAQERLTGEHEGAGRGFPSNADLAAAHADVLVIEVGVAVVALLPIAQLDARALLRRPDRRRRVVGRQRDARARAGLGQAEALPHRAAEDGLHKLLHLCEAMQTRREWV